MSDTDKPRSTPASPNTLRRRNPLRSESSKRQAKKLPGSRSKWSTASWGERLQWLFITPIRTVICISNITIFLFAYLFFMGPMLWAKTLWPRLYWGYEGKLYRWLQAFIGYWGYTAGYDIYEYGDDISQYCDSERVLVMCNHQSTADVPCLFAILQHKGVASRKTVWLMDQMFRWTPFGIIGQMHGDYFIKQGKATRDSELVRLKEHLRNVFWERDRRWVVLFPEGGFYYKRIDQSQEYGRKHGFPHLEHVTLPRMGAVQAILEEVGPRDDNGEITKTRSGSKIEIIKDTIGAIREKKYVKETRPPIKYVLDITIAYPNGQPLSLWTLCFGTREECAIAVHYKMFKVEDVPFDDEIKLRDWMYKVYEEKDQLLDNFYQFGEFNRHDETGERIIFPWQKIILQYLFWVTSFIVQIKLYSFLLSQFYQFLFPSY